jgi:hypothetical protein
MLVLTENSSTSLTATLDGTALVVSACCDNYGVAIPPPDFLFVFQLFWYEPEPGNPSFPAVNGVFLRTSEVDGCPEDTCGRQILVISEDSLPQPGLPINSNGSSATVHNVLSTPNGVQDLTVVFNDNADPSEVPEPSTLSYMILVALVSVMVFRRKLTGGFSHSGTASYKWGRTL